MSDSKQRDKFDNWSRSCFRPWELRRALKSGGNARVYRVDHPDGRVGAMKVLKREYQKSDREPFKRFRQEVRINKEICTHRGVMPIWDSRIPESPSTSNPAWFVMPLAVPLRQYLGSNSTLRRVTEAVEAVAATLADLAGMDIYHRDIKPENLFILDGSTTIGDFGLVHSPETESLTRIGRAFGSRHYYAPEMRDPSTTTDYSRADVYSLAKTLWVLGTNQNTPPEGELRLDTPQVLLSTWVQDEDAAVLDRLIARSTTHDSTMRPSMAEFRDELRALLRSPAERPQMPNLQSIAEEVAALTAPAQKEQREKEERLEASRQILMYVQPQLNEVGKKVADNGFNVSNAPYYANSAGLFVEHFLSDPIQDHDWRDGVAFGIASPGTYPVMLWSGFALILLPDGYLTIIAAHLARDTRTMKKYNDFKTLWHAQRREYVGSASLRHAADELLAELEGTLGSALTEYKRLLTQPSQQNSFGVNHSHEG